MKKILVPIDFSEESQNALDLAVQLARKASAQIELLHVFDDTLGQSFNTTGEMELVSSSFDNAYFIKLVEKVKRDIKALIQNDANMDVDIIENLKIGSIFQHIVDIVDRKKIDLIVMGSKGASGIKELLVGSNTEKVIRYAKCPVLVVKEKTNLASIKKLLFASDLVTEQKGLIDELKNIIKLLDLELTIVKINTHHRWLSNDELLHQLEEFTTKYDLECEHLEIFEDSYIEDGVIRFAEKENVDIIAMGTHGRTGVAHMIAGSVAENLANHAHRLFWTCSY